MTTTNRDKSHRKPVVVSHPSAGDSLVWSQRANPPRERTAHGTRIDRPSTRFAGSADASLAHAPENGITKRPTTAGLLDDLGALATPAVEFDAAGGDCHHSVSLHETDAGLCDLATAFLASGLSRGEPLVVIATDPHVGAVRDRLHAAGADVRALSSSGQLRLLSVREALSKILSGSVPDWERFRDWTDRVLNDGAGRGTSPGSRVRVFVEISDVLWKAGQREAAARIEEMWGRLRQTRPLALLCAYELVSAYDQDIDFCQQVCATHSHALRLRNEVQDAEASRVVLTPLPLRSLRKLVVEINRHGQTRRTLGAMRRAFADAHAELGSSQRRVELLTTMATGVAAARTVHEACSVVLEAAETLLGAVGSAVLTRGASGALRFTACRGLSENFARAMAARAPWSEPIRAGAPILIGDVRCDLPSAPEVSLLRQQGIASFAMLPLFAGGKPLGKFIVCHDEPQSALREPRVARAIAAHAASALGRFSPLAEPASGGSSVEMFAGMLGHELRTPLQTLLFSAHVALTNEDASARGKALARITASGQRMARLIDRLFDFTRARAAGGIPVNLAPVDVVHLLKSLLDELNVLHTGSTLNLEHVSGDARGAWDRERLSQVFVNLLTNALHHGAREYGVQLAVDGTAADLVHVDIHNMGALPRALLPRLFEPLVQSPEARTHGGLGLGLYISHEIVRAHGGSISVRSSEADGTTFRVSLPRVTRAAGKGRSLDGSA